MSGGRLLQPGACLRAWRGTTSDGRRGAREALPFCVPVFAFGISLGVLARNAGYPVTAVVAMSLLTFVGSSQFATVSVVGNGGDIATAVFAGGLLNLRYLVMGFAISPALRGSRLRRARDAQLVIEESWALAVTKDGSFNYPRLMGAGLMLWLAWGAGTAVGALGSWSSADLHALGLDAVAPALFFLLLAPHLDTMNRRLLAGCSIGVSLLCLAGGVVNWAIIAVAMLALLWTWRRP